MALMGRWCAITSRVLREPLRDDFINVGGKTETDVSSLDFDMLDVWS